VKTTFKVTSRHSSSDAYKAASRTYYKKIKAAVNFLLIFLRTSLSAHKLATGKKIDNFQIFLVVIEILDIFSRPRLKAN
jgi:hypothetical protein